MKNFLSILSFAFLLLQNAYGQEGVIRLKNPSFEGIPQEGSVNGDMIDGWYDCGFPNESIPDVHPKKGSTFKVETPPAHGSTYLGLVVRDNDTWERVSQRLDPPLEAGVQYEFTISLARSLIYESPSRKSSQSVNFVTPAKLRLWGGHSICGRKELLAETDPIMNSKWLDYTFVLQPSENYYYLIFEAFYNTPTPFPYNGNVLLDHASDIVPIDSSGVKADSINRSKYYAQVQPEEPILYEEKDYVIPGTNLLRFEYSEPHMGTEFKMVLYAENDSLANSAAAEAFARIAELEQVFSDYEESSELSRLSTIAGTDMRAKASNDLWNVLLYARKVTDRSGGAFDFTAGALTKIWRRAFRQKEMPDDAEIQKALATVGFKKVVFNAGQEIEIWQEGLRIDLGGIAKGYAVDETLKILKNRAITRSLVDGGGDIAVGEAPPGQEGWMLERAVYGQNGQVATEPITLANQAIATSGDTERFLEQGGKRYSHIIDPRTGYGVSKREIVSVVASSCIEADAWATALSVEVEEKVYSWMKRQGMRAYFSK
ncbi:MAG: FAD:protein FMN transferase [Saprospiraceae bacterium]